MIIWTKKPLSNIILGGFTFWCAGGRYKKGELLNANQLLILGKVSHQSRFLRKTSFLIPNKRKQLVSKQCSFIYSAPSQYHNRFGGSPVVFSDAQLFIREFSSLASTGFLMSQRALKRTGTTRGCWRKGLLSTRWNNILENG